MKKILFIAFTLSCISYLFAQQNEVKIEKKYGTENKDIQDILRFEGIEIIDLKYTGEYLKGKNYTIIVKEFLNGSLAQSDTIIKSQDNNFIKAISDSTFKFKYLVKTKLNNTIKMSFKFDGFSITKNYPIRKSKDAYALHDLLENNKSISISSSDSTNILGYFLPYNDEKTGMKMYCQVSGSEHSPEEWGKVFSIPNYFLVSIIFD